MIASQRPTIGLLIGLVAVLATVQSAVADAVLPTAPPTSAPSAQDARLVSTSLIYVVGADAGISVHGTGFAASCAGTDVQLGLYAIGVLPNSDVSVPVRPTRPELRQQVSVRVDDSGSFDGTIPLPAQLTGDPALLAPGVVAPCMDGALVVGEPVQVAKLDPAENPGGSGTIVIPFHALNAGANFTGATYAELVKELTVSANGIKCTTVSLTGGPAIDTTGNARIHVGTVDQPAVCHQPGATLTFVNENGQAFFEKYTFLPGVTQVLQNFAAEPPVTGGTPSATPGTTTPAPTATGVAPLAPNTGTGSASGSETNAWIALFGVLTAVLGLAGIAATRRRS